MSSLENEKMEFLREFAYHLILAYGNKLSEQRLEKKSEEVTKAISVASEVQKSEAVQEVKEKLKAEERRIIPRYFPTGVKITVQQISPQPQAQEAIVKPITRGIEEKPEIAPPAEPPAQAPQKQQPFVTGIPKIDDLLKDNAVKSIECLDGNIKIKRDSETVNTSIILTKQEVADLIKKFSEEVKEPLTKNIFKAAVQNLKIIAVISDLIGPRFIITRE